MIQVHRDPVFEEVAAREANEHRVTAQCGPCAYRIVVRGIDLKPVPGCAIKKSGGYGRKNCNYRMVTGEANGA